MVARGTAFEQKSLNILQSNLSMSLSRVGGASDGGVDLHGWWWLPSSHDSLQASVSGLGATTRRRIRVLAQCKAYVKKIGPNVVREMEGVLLRHGNAEDRWPSENSNSARQEDRIKEDAIAVLISKSPFTKQTILRTLSSTVPFLLLHLPEAIPSLLAASQPLQQSESRLKTGKDDPEIGSILWNHALAGKDGILRGEYVIRWVRSPNDVCGRPAVWRNERPVENWVPSTTHE